MLHCCVLPFSRLLLEVHVTHPGMNLPHHFRGLLVQLDHGILMARPSSAVSPESTITTRTGPDGNDALASGDDIPEPA